MRHTFSQISGDFLTAITIALCAFAAVFVIPNLARADCLKSDIQIQSGHPVGPLSGAPDSLPTTIPITQTVTYHLDSDCSLPMKFRMYAWYEHTTPEWNDGPKQIPATESSIQFAYNEFTLTDKDGSFSFTTKMPTTFQNDQLFYYCPWGNGSNMGWACFGITYSVKWSYELVGPDNACMAGAGQLPAWWAQYGGWLRAGTLPGPGGYDPGSQVEYLTPSQTVPGNGELRPQYDPTVKPVGVSFGNPLFDPDYARNSITERKFRPYPPVSPFDSFVIPVTIPCFPGGWSSISLSLITRDSTGEEITLATTTADKTVRIADRNYWKILGWPNGITDDPRKLDILIESIHLRRAIRAVARWVADGSLLAGTDIPMTNCFHFYGEGKNNIVQMHAESAKYNEDVGFSFNPPDKFVQTAQTIQKSGFGGYDQSTGRYFGLAPFNRKEYEFSHYADLYPYPDRRLYFDERGFFRRSEFVSSCTVPKKEGILYNARTRKSYYRIGYPFAIVRVNENNAFPVELAMHETGHIFGLQDEYLDTEYDRGRRWNGRNCVLDPGEEGRDRVFRYPQPNGIKYGDSKYLGCTIPNALRPSDYSIMRKSSEFRYNVVGCGFILSQIVSSNSRNAADYWPACMTMEGLVKPGN